MKRLLLFISFAIFSMNYIMADITISVPKKWKGRTLYVWQTDINQVFSRNEDEPIHQIKDTIRIHELTFSIPTKLDCAAKVNILTPKKDESDYDHTIGEACVMPGEEVHLHLNDNTVTAEGSLLNQQMADIYTNYMQSLSPFEEAYARGDRDEVSRIARESQQWNVDWIKANPGSPGASVALYQLSNPRVVVELSSVLQGEALTSLFYPYAENHVNRCRLILQRQETQATLDDKEAPDFTLTDIAGNSVSLSDFRGKWVVLDFWGSWCAPCLKGMPELKEIYEAYHDRLEIIGIGCNDTVDALKKVVSRLQLPWIQLYHTDSDTVASAYSVTAFPTKVVINPEGKIKRTYTGASPTFMTDISEWLK